MSILAEHPLSINRTFRQRPDGQLLAWFASVAAGDDPAGARMAFSDWCEETGPVARPDRVGGDLPLGFCGRFFRTWGRSLPYGLLAGCTAEADNQTRRAMSHLAGQITPGLAVGPAVVWRWWDRSGGPDRWAVVLPAVTPSPPARIDALWLLGECFSVGLPWLVSPVSLDPTRRHAGPTLVILGDEWGRLAAREGGRDA